VLLKLIICLFTFNHMKSDQHVFVVDDDLSARNGLARLIRTAGYNVHSFATTGSFLKFIESESHGCVLLDARMPGSSNDELKQKLFKYSQKLAVIFVTADDDDDTRRKAKEMNAVGFFRKPVDGPALLDAIDWALKPSNTEKANGNRLKK
jgi:FixJ family two-component response regulator